jgi:hypothetical protein
MAHDVFISYSSKDKLTADAMCAALESRGLRCWIAPRDILPGSDWDEAIIDGIERCRAMILVFSAHANGSSQIKREVGFAIERGVTVVPFRIEDVTPDKKLKFFLMTQHWLDAMTPPLEEHLQRLAETLRFLIDRLPAGEVNDGQETEPVSPPSKTPTTTSDRTEISAPPKRVADVRPSTAPSSAPPGKAISKQLLLWGITPLAIGLSFFVLPVLVNILSPLLTLVFDYEVIHLVPRIVLVGVVAGLLRMVRAQDAGLQGLADQGVSDAYATRSEKLKFWGATLLTAGISLFIFRLFAMLVFDTTIFESYWGASPTLAIIAAVAGASLLMIRWFRWH